MIAKLMLASLFITAQIGATAAEQKYGEAMLFCSQYKYALERAVEFDHDIDLLGNYRFPIVNRITSAFVGHGAHETRFQLDRTAMLAELVRWWASNSRDMHSLIRHWEDELLDLNDSPAGLHVTARSIAKAFKIRMGVTDWMCRDTHRDGSTQFACDEQCSQDPEIIKLLSRMGISP